MSSERKRSKGPAAEDQEESRRSKKQRLEESSSLSEQEISVHARLDEDDFLHSPAPASESEYSYPSSVQHSDASPLRQEGSDGEAFPLVKGEATGEGSAGEKRKVRRRYRGTGDSQERERETWERNERDRRRRSHSREREERSREHRVRGKRPSSARSSPQHRGHERPRRAEREVWPPHPTREHSLKRRVDEWRERERDERRSSYPHEHEERLHSRERRELYDGRRLEQREPPRWREDRERQRERQMRDDRHPPRRARSRERERHKRLPRPGREEPFQLQEWGRERESAMTKERGRERHHHRHSRHHQKEKPKTEAVEEKKRRASVSDIDSDESPQREHPESEKIEDLIKELVEGDEVSSSESEHSEKEGKEHERVSEDSVDSDTEVERGRSDVSETGSLPEGKRKRDTSTSAVSDDNDDKSPSPVEHTEPGVMRSKFDVDDEDEEESREGMRRPLRKGYSGYEAFAVSDASEGEGEVEEIHTPPEEDREEKEEIEEEEEERSPTPELPPYLPALMGCRNVENYEWLNRIEEGTYGVVYRAKDKRTGQIVALKKLKMEKEKEGFPITSLREINMLLKAKHPNIVHVREIVVGSNMDKIYIVMDYVEHDLKSLMETMKQPFLEGEVKTLTMQLLRAVHHLHDNWILHRDLKASNLLLSHKGVLKVGDFGLAREYGSPLRPYTPVVVTLWYRAPELLLGVKEYSTAVDMWSVGCIFAEFLIHKPLFQGKSEIDQLNQIFKELGTPSEAIWPGYNQLPFVKKVTFTKQPYNHLRKRFPYLTNNGFDLLNRFLTYDPKKRITAEQALKHDYFTESPLPVSPSMFPTWPARSEMVRKKRERSPQAPEGGAFKFNKEDDDEVMGFRLTQAQHGQAAVGAGFSLKF